MIAVTTARAEVSRLEAALQRARGAGQEREAAVLAAQLDAAAATLTQKEAVLSAVQGGGCSAQA
ncbi:MAG: hypothetical protein ACK4QW_19210, partial [Alphaproteobacteria bacterium]